MAETWNPMSAAPATMPLREAVEVLFDATGVTTKTACGWCEGIAPEDGCGDREPEIEHASGCAVARLLEAVNVR